MAVHVKFTVDGVGFEAAYSEPERALDALESFIEKYRGSYRLEQGEEGLRDALSSSFDSISRRASWWVVGDNITRRGEEGEGNGR